MVVFRSRALDRIIAVVFALVVCAGLFQFFSRPSSALPPEMPQSFTLTWRSGGGMDPSGADVTLRGTAGIAQSWSASTPPATHEEKSFTLSDADAKAIYRYLRAHGADTIVVDAGGIVDGNNDGYDISWDDTSIHVWGMAVADADEQRFRAIYQYLGEQFAPYLPSTL